MPRSLLIGTLLLATGCGCGSFTFEAPDAASGRFSNTCLAGQSLSARDLDDGRVELGWTPGGAESWEVYVFVPADQIADGATVGFEDGLEGLAYSLTIDRDGAMPLSDGQVTFSSVRGGPTCAAGLEARVSYDLEFGDGGERSGSGSGSNPIWLCL